MKIMMRVRYLIEQSYLESKSRAWGKAVPQQVNQGWECATEPIGDCLQELFVVNNTGLCRVLRLTCKHGRFPVTKVVSVMLADVPNQTEDVFWIVFTVSSCPP